MRIDAALMETEKSVKIKVVEEQYKSKRQSKLFIFVSIYAVDHERNREEQESQSNRLYLLREEEYSLSKEVLLVRLSPLMW